MLAFSIAPAQGFRSKRQCLQDLSFTRMEFEGILVVSGPGAYA